MKEQYERTALLIGEAAVDRLTKSRVAVFGIGGVGGYVCEALVRSGVGAFDLIDKDRVDITNLNRQIIATADTVGLSKVEVMKTRMKAIDPDVTIRTYETFFLPENAEQFPFTEYDCIVDAVDTVTAKIELIMRAKEFGVPIVSSMGAGNKLDPSAFCADDLSRTSVCPLARVLRRELKKRGVEHVRVVYSKEEPLKPQEEPLSEPRRRSVPGSIAYVPAAAGLVIASEVVKILLDQSDPYSCSRKEPL